jgi:hypothetical protein
LNLMRRLVKEQLLKFDACSLKRACERKNAQEALSHNTLVQSWPEIVRLSQATGPVPVQATLEGLEA